MKELPKKLNGPKRDDLQNVVFTQLNKKDDIYLYKRSDGVYEVFKALKQKERKRIIKGKEVIQKEKYVYPSGDSFHGYTTREFVEAIKKFDECTGIKRDYSSYINKEDSKEEIIEEEKDIFVPKVGILLRDAKSSKEIMFLSPLDCSEATGIPVGTIINNAKDSNSIKDGYYFKLIVV